MKHKNVSRNALLASIISMLLCVSMLVGTTFAWFTDEVTSANNIIKAGNLDVEMEWASGKEAPASANWIDASTGAIFDYDLWEPGYTEARHIRIINKGTLALNWNLAIVPNGEVSALGDAIDVYCSKNEATQIVDRDVTDLEYKGTLTEWISTGITTGNLDAGKEYSLTLVLKMREEAGNEYKNLSIGTDFAVKLTATQYTKESDSFGPDYDKFATPIVVKSAEAAQEALNTLENGSTIQLAPGVNYGTLEIVAQVGAENKKPVVNNDNTDAVDYFTTKYPTGEFVRKIENVTILGAPGAKVDGIKFVTGTFKVVTDPATGKQSGTMYRWVEIKNLVIDGVEFTDASTLGTSTKYVSPIFLDLQSVKVDGLTVKNCKLEGNKSNMNFVYAYGSAAKDCDFGITLNNVVIANNTVSGIARLCELREANNVTVQGNTVKDLTRELTLFANNSGKVYSGNIKVIGNTADNVAIDYTADGVNALFVRVGAGGDASVVVKDNVITNTTPIDVANFVRVTGHTGTLTVENNTLG